MLKRVLILGLLLAATAALFITGRSEQTEARESNGGPEWAPAVQPKPLGDASIQGLKWLVANQHENGGWSQGEESKQMGAGGNLAYTPNVADTCIATLALMRAGSTPSDGPHAKAIQKALGFLAEEIEASEADSLYVTSVKGTRVQSKLGPYIDTFLASMVLAEAKGNMPDPKSEKRIAAALDKVIDKVQKNQKGDGTWDSTGWAPVLSQSMATKGLNRARQAGAPVDDKTLEMASGYAVGQYDRESGTFKAEGSAGVDLYASGANLSSMQDSVNTNAAREKELREIAQNSKDPKKRDQAKDQLARFEETKRVQEESRQALVGRLEDDAFVKGFGSNGGEEFLSYMNISESLVVKGGPDWKKWDQAMTTNLSRIQNPDGSWSGHHCITGRTFCTAAAVLVLTADRAPVPVAARVED